jgi:hypothetical protein
MFIIPGVQEELVRDGAVSGEGVGVMKGKPADNVVKGNPADNVVKGNPAHRRLELLHYYARKLEIEAISITVHLLSCIFPLINILSVVRK